MIIIDDGSADGTTRVAFDFVKRYLVENVRVILLGRNHGKGEAIRKVSAIKIIHSFMRIYSQFVIYLFLAIWISVLLLRKHCITGNAALTW